MAKGQIQKPIFRVGQICIFANRGGSGITKNDGKRCRITRVKPTEMWVEGEPGYVIEFVDEDHGFGVRECELEPVV